MGRSPLRPTREGWGPIADHADDLALLRAYEPVIRYTAGELFLPADVDGYVAASALWEDVGTSGVRSLAEHGALSIERLTAEASARPDATLSLQFVDRPLSRRELWAWRRRSERPVFRARGRFTEVGLLARVLDALFRVSLLLRGPVPGGLAAAAEVRARPAAAARRHPYYGRVLHDAGYVVAQYWCFYAMNDWRSSFGGANDHEGDWEHVTVFLTPTGDGSLSPVWIAISAHDEVGDDLRRRWDDPDLQRESDHPVVFAGAGSHSGAFVPGEYVTAVEPPGVLGRIFPAMRWIARLLTPWSRGEIARGVGIPFVDYARGDGEVVGPGHDRTWDAVVIDDATPWVGRYRGLWGLDTGDRFGGERAPAGPRYERSGEVRRSWADPVGWCGLDKVPATAAEAERLLAGRVDELDDELARLDTVIEERRSSLRRTSAAVSSIHGRRGLRSRVVALRSTVGAESHEVGQLVAMRSALAGERDAHQETLANGPRPMAAQAHLLHKVVPIDRQRDERDRLLRVWSTVSAPLLFLVVAFLLVDTRFGIVAGAGVFVLLFLTVESIARHHFIAFALTAAAVVATVFVVFAVVQGLLGNWQLVLAAVLAALAAAVLVANLRDLRRS